MNTHPETFLQIDKLGSRIPPYNPTFDFLDSFIDESHRRFMDCPTDGAKIQVNWSGKIIPGSLRREDALKLYEIAYFTAEDILELGADRGLSTSILSRANHNSPNKKHIYSVDLNPKCVKATENNLKAAGLYKDITIICDDAILAVKRFASQKKQFGFIFVDHSHAYEPVYQVCRDLRKITAKGGFCLFHDFNDRRNRDLHNEQYGVYQAVIDGLNEKEFEFYGIYGCAALYRAI